MSRSMAGRSACEFFCFSPPWLTLLLLLTHESRDKVKIFGKLEVEGTLEVQGSLEVWGPLTINGYLYVLSPGLGCLSSRRPGGKTAADADAGSARP